MKTNFRVWTLALCCAACTPVSRPDSLEAEPGDAGPDGSTESTPDARCERDGELRCGSAPRQRERCENRRWVAWEPCAEGDVCVDDPSPGQCSKVLDACRGSASATVCDAMGALYRCGAAGVVESSERCTSLRHCQLGIAAGSCATCSPGEFRCTGDALEVCDEAGRQYRKLESCPAGTCDADAGMCRGGTCTEERAICRGDVLAICARGASAFNEAARCGPGLCNAAGARCDACVPGVKTCEGESAVSCSSDGQRRERRDCAQDQLHCVGGGQCVECAKDADCASPAPCKNAYCDVVSGVCKVQPRPVRSVCPDGMCSADGECVACLADEDCPAVGSCQIRSCDRETHRCTPKPVERGTRCGAGVCDAAGACVGCVDDSGCPPPGECQRRSCDAATKVCDPEPAPDGEACRGSFGEGSCQSGRCVQCRSDADCGRGDPCEQAFCRTTDNTCQRRPSPAGAACGGGGVCDGAGDCVECSADLHCGANASCVDNQCSCNPGFAPNLTDIGCNFDDCAKFDDNRCGADASTGNTCINTVDGFDCTCRAPWKLGADQCFRGGTAADVRTVKNGASWNVVPEFGIACENAFDRDVPCSPGQLAWLNVCGLPETNPNDCAVITGNTEGLLAVNLKRVAHSGPLQDYGQPNGPGTSEVLLPAAGDVILVQTLTTMYVMRITALDGGSMSYEWAEVWRDACWRPGGLLCTAACGCPNGS